MTTDTKPRAPRTPRNYETILKGALALTLEERIRLTSEIGKANTEEVNAAVAKAEAAKKLLNGSAGS